MDNRASMSSWPGLSFIMRGTVDRSSDRPYLRGGTLTQALNQGPCADDR